MNEILDGAKAILYKDEFNIQASIIAAVIFAESNYFEQAKKIFLQLLESKELNPSIILNMAHMDFLQVRGRDFWKLSKKIESLFERNSGLHELPQEGEVCR